MKFGLDKLFTIHATCILLIQVVAPVKSARLKLTNIQCRALNESLGDFKMCSLKAVKRDVVELNVHFAVAMKPINNTSFILRLKKRGDLSNSALFQYKIDLCEFLRSDRRKPLADLFYSVFDLRKYSNLNHSCPYNHDIIVNRCRLNTNFLNVLAISPGEYTVHTNWFVHDKPIADADISIQIN